MDNKQKRQNRAGRTRFGLKNSAARNPRLRLSIYRSNDNIYAQIVDDSKGATLASASTVDKKLKKDIKNASSVAAAETVGKAVAERAVKAGVKDVYFDRGGYRYMGRIKALADAARAAGLNF